MHDKVLSIIRETLLHENTIEGVSVDVCGRSVRISFAQPDESYQYPDHELTLTFHCIKEFEVQTEFEQDTPFQELLGIECQRTEDFYSAQVTLGRAGESQKCQLKLTFEDLTYERK